jgi:hypothetical protein
MIRLHPTLSCVRAWRSCANVSPHSKRLRRSLLHGGLGEIGTVSRQTQSENAGPLLQPIQETVRPDPVHCQRARAVTPQNLVSLRHRCFHCSAWQILARKAHRWLSCHRTVRGGKCTLGRGRGLHPSTRIQAVSLGRMPYDYDDSPALQAARCPP